jgi:hypothetical protein
LLIRELKLRGLAERGQVTCPANLTFQWQRELKEKFEEKFVALKGDLIREQFGFNQWLETPSVGLPFLLRESPRDHLVLRDVWLSSRVISVTSRWL